MKKEDQQRIHQIDARLSEIDRIFQSHQTTTIPIDSKKYISLRDEALKIIAERGIIQSRQSKLKVV